MAGMKILTVCQGGQVRSVALKYRLTYVYGHEAIPCGVQSNSKDTIRMLCHWADWTIILQPEFKAWIPPEYHGKLFCYDVGADRWANPFHPELQAILDQLIKKHGKFL